MIYLHFTKLEKKSAELTKAVAQYYLLQKEHAFYKLDNAFAGSKALMAPNGNSQVCLRPVNKNIKKNIIKNLKKLNKK